ncbi:MAG: LysM peptidoglycan-binding domain-containing protein [Bacillota bacterium]
MKNFRGKNIAIEGKTVRELEEYLYRRRSIKFFSPKNVLLLLMCILFASAAVFFWNMKKEISSLKNEITQLNSENEVLKKQVDGYKTNQQTVIQSAGKGGTAVQSTPASQNASNQGNDIIYHVVGAGDCFEVISNKYYGTEKYAPDLARLNGMTVNSIMRVGQKIKVPNKPDPAWNN